MCKPQESTAAIPIFFKIKEKQKEINIQQQRHGIMNFTLACMQIGNVRNVLSLLLNVDFLLFLFYFKKKMGIAAVLSCGLHMYDIHFLQEI